MRRSNAISIPPGRLQSGRVSTAFRQPRTARLWRAQRLIAPFALAVGLVASAGPARAQDFVMKFATQTINDMQHEYIKVYKTELEKATNNRIKVEVYPASQLGGAQRQVEGLRLGTIEAAIGPSELFFGADPRFQVLALSGLFKNNEHARRALDVPAFRKAIDRK